MTPEILLEFITGMTLLAITEILPKVFDIPEDLK